MWPFSAYINWPLRISNCFHMMCTSWDDIWPVLHLQRLIRMLNFIVSNYLSINLDFIEILTERKRETERQRARERERERGTSADEVDFARDDDEQRACRACFVCVCVCVCRACNSQRGLLAMEMNVEEMNFNNVIWGSNPFDICYRIHWNASAHCMLWCTCIVSAASSTVCYAKNHSN